MTETIFKRVNGFPDYRVGDDGSVWRFYRGAKVGKSRPGPRWKRLAPVRLRNGYLKVTLCRTGERREILIHALVLEAFVGSRPWHMEAAHRNGLRTDCRLCNLEWKSHRANEEDKIRHGTRLLGERHPMSKLTDAQAREIYHRYWSEETSARKLSKEYGVCASTIENIVGRKGWKHLIEPD